MASQACVSISQRFSPAVNIHSSAGSSRNKPKYQEAFRELTSCAPSGGGATDMAAGSNYSNRASEIKIKMENEPGIGNVSSCGA